MAGATIFPIGALPRRRRAAPDGFQCNIVGLAIDSNSGKGGPEFDGCAGVIFAFTMAGAEACENSRCVILDWDIQSLAQGGSSLGCR